MFIYFFNGTYASYNILGNNLLLTTNKSKLNLTAFKNKNKIGDCIIYKKVLLNKIDFSKAIPSHYSNLLFEIRIMCVIVD